MATQDNEGYQPRLGNLVGNEILRAQQQFLFFEEIRGTQLSYDPNFQPQNSFVARWNTANPSYILLEHEDGSLHPGRMDVNGGVVKAAPSIPKEQFGVFLERHNLTMAVAPEPENPGHSVEPTAENHKGTVTSVVDVVQSRHIFEAISEEPEAKRTFTRIDEDIGVLKSDLSLRDNTVAVWTNYEGYFLTLSSDGSAIPGTILPDSTDYRVIPADNPIPPDRIAEYLATHKITAPALEETMRGLQAGRSIDEIDVAAVATAAPVVDAPVAVPPPPPPSPVEPVIEESSQQKAATTPPIVAWSDEDKTKQQQAELQNTAARMFNNMTNPASATTTTLAATSAPEPEAKSQPDVQALAAQWRETQAAMVKAREAVQASSTAVGEAQSAANEVKNLKLGPEVSVAQAEAVPQPAFEAMEAAHNKIPPTPSQARKQRVAREGYNSFEPNSADYQSADASATVASSTSIAAEAPAATQTAQTAENTTDTKVHKVAATTETSEPRTHTVKSGDSLSKIAAVTLGDASRWKEIYAANKEIIGDNPDLIHPGMKFEIPAPQKQMLVTNEAAQQQPAAEVAKAPTEVKVPVAFTGAPGSVSATELPSDFPGGTAKYKASALVDHAHAALNTGNTDTINAANRRIASILKEPENEEIRDHFRAKRNETALDARLQEHKEGLLARKAEVEAKLVEKQAELKSLTTSPKEASASSSIEATLNDKPEIKAAVKQARAGIAKENKPGLADMPDELPAVALTGIQQQQGAEVRAV